MQSGQDAPVCGQSGLRAQVEGVLTRQRLPVPSLPYGAIRSFHQIEASLVITLSRTQGVTTYTEEPAGTPKPLT